MNEVHRHRNMRFLDSLPFPVSKASVEILLRLPPLYLMDFILMSEMGVAWVPSVFEDLDVAGNNTITTKDANGFNVRITSAPDVPDGIFDDGNWTMENVYWNLYGATGHEGRAIMPYVLNFFGCFYGYLFAAFLVTLSAAQLAEFYAYVFAAAALPASYLSHFIMSDALGNLALGQAEESAQWYVHKYLSTWIPYVTDMALGPRAIVVNYLIQSVLGLLLGTLLTIHFSPPRDNPNMVLKAVAVSMLSPNLFAMCSVPRDVLDMTIALSLVLPAGLTAYALWVVAGRGIVSVMQNVRTKRQYIANFGLNTFLETEWTRIRVPSLLRTFWLTRVGLHLCTELFALFVAAAAAPSATLHSLGDIDGVADVVVALARDLVTRGCETLLAVLGMTSIVSTACHYVGVFFHLLLRHDDDEEKSVASVSAVLFFVLALQTGLTSLEPEKRFTRLCKNLCLLLTALFHFIHNIVSPVLMSLGASHNYNGRRHLRALSICAFLVAAPVALMAYLWGAFSVGTWLLAVSAFCVEVVVKVTVTVAVYLLFLYDQWYKEGTWEMLDDSVYYVKAAGNSVEFCFAVFLFFNGGWILLFESGGTIRAVMMLIHAYCNIWCEAKAGWNTFIKRRTAVSKINRLPEATAEQLERNADVCAICYQDMTTAKVTRCNHLFHGFCLRKWLYVQDTCPLCHTPLYKSHQRSQSSQTRDGEQQLLPHHQQQQQEQQRVQRARARPVVAAAAGAFDELIDNDVIDTSSSGEDDDDGVSSHDEDSDASTISSSSSDALIYDSMEEHDDVDDDVDDDDDDTEAGDGLNDDIGNNRHHNGAPPNVA